MDLLTKLNTAIRATDEAAWPAKRDALADALAAGAGEAGSQARKDKEAMFAEFLDSLRKMPEADFEQKKQELAAGLEALVPPGTPLGLVYGLIDPAVAVQAMDRSFLHYKAQGLLKEMQAARQKPAGQ